MFGVCQGISTDFFVGNCRIVHKQLPLPKLRNDYRPGTNGGTSGAKPMGVRCEAEHGGHRHLAVRRNFRRAQSDREVTADTTSAAISPAALKIAP